MRNRNKDDRYSWEDDNSRNARSDRKRYDVSYGDEEKQPWKGDTYESMRNYGPDNFHDDDREERVDNEAREARRARQDRERFASSSYGRDHGYGRGYGADDYQDYRNEPRSARGRNTVRNPFMRESMMDPGPFSDADRTYFSGTQHNEDRAPSTARLEHGHDPDYISWRDAELARHDTAYRDWRNAQAKTYDSAYGEWRKSRQDRFAKDFTDWRTSQNSSASSPGQSTGTHAPSTGSILGTQESAKDKNTSK